MTKRPLHFALAALGCAILVAASVPGSAGRDPSDAQIIAAENDIAGVVTGPKGPRDA